MALLLYWCVYHLDLGPLGPSALNLALKTWHKEVKGHELLRAFVPAVPRALLRKPDLDQC
jgi:hypothetical protein